MSAARKNSMVRLTTIVQLVCVSLTVCGVGVGYVWQLNQLDELEAERRALDTRFMDLESESSELQKRLEQATSTAKLQPMAERLGLRQPLPRQIVRLPDPAAYGNAPAPELNLARH